MGGFGRFDRTTSLVGSLVVFGVVFGMVTVFDGSRGGQSYQEPEEDPDRVLIEAVRSNATIREVEGIIREDPWRVSEERLRGWHPIHVAVAQVAQRGQPLALIQTLLDHGADINGEIEPGWDRHRATPLLIAIPYSNVEVVRFLIQRGADPAARDEGGQGAAELAEGLWNEEIRREMRLIIETASR
jgi:hypothetical protein